jgi:hypothetical protein
MAYYTRELCVPCRVWEGCCMGTGESNRDATASYSTIIERCTLPSVTGSCVHRSP